MNLSIIIPHYNTPQTLEKLLLSIPSKEDVEIIVVDDKSNKEVDYLNTLISEYSASKENFLFLRNFSDKKGAGVCRNIGLDYAQGKWVLFADADDFFVEGFYDHVNKYFLTNYEVVFFNTTSIIQDSGKESDRHLHYRHLVLDYLEKQNLVTETRLRYMFPSPCAKLIRRNFIKDHGLRFNEVIASNDVMFSTKLGFFMERFCVDPQIIYCITRNIGSLTTSNDKEVFKSRLNEFIKCQTFLRNRLDIEPWKIVKRSGLGFLYSAIIVQKSLREALYVWKMLRKYNIPIFDWKFVNPLHLYRKVLSAIKAERNLSKYREMDEK